MYQYKKEKKPKKCGSNVFNKKKKEKVCKITKALNKDVEQLKKDKLTKPENIFEDYKK